MYYRSVILEGKKQREDGSCDKRNKYKDFWQKKQTTTNTVLKRILSLKSGQKGGGEGQGRRARERSKERIEGKEERKNSEFQSLCKKLKR